MSSIFVLSEFDESSDSYWPILGCEERQDADHFNEVTYNDRCRVDEVPLVGSERRD